MPAVGRLVILMMGISHDLEKLGRAMDATTVLGRTRAFAGDTTRMAAVVIG